MVSVLAEKEAHSHLAAKWREEEKLLYFETKSRDGDDCATEEALAVTRFRNEWGAPHRRHFKLPYMTLGAVRVAKGLQKWCIKYLLFRQSTSGTPNINFASTLSADTLRELSSDRVLAKKRVWALKLGVGRTRREERLEEFFCNLKKVHALSRW